MAHDRSDVKFENHFNFTSVLLKPFLLVYIIDIILKIQSLITVMIYIIPR